MSVIIPIIGLVLWALKNNETPNAAKAYGTAALIVCGAWLVLYVLISIIVSSAVSGFIQGI